MNALSDNIVARAGLTVTRSLLNQLLVDASSNLLQHEAALGGIDRIVVHDLMEEGIKTDNRVLMAAADEITSMLSIVRRDINATYDLLNLDAPGIAEKHSDQRVAPSTAVARHVELMRRRDFDTALAKYRAAERTSADVSTKSDTEVDAAAAAESAALKKLAATRAPDAKALHLKAVAIDSGGAWATDGMLAGILLDIEALAQGAPHES